MKPNASPSVYLHALADAAGDWFSKRPNDAPGLARRINEMRRGCSTLILAEHRPLSDADRDWLRERCRAWAGKFDKSLAELEGGKDVRKVRAEMDATVNQLIKAIRARAAQVA
jgi:hypothetical protein